MSHRLVSPPLARTVSSQTGSHHMQMSHTLIALVTCAQVFRSNIRPAPGFQIPMLKVLLVLLGLQLAPARAGAKHKQDRIDNSTFTRCFSLAEHPDAVWEQCVYGDKGCPAACSGRGVCFFGVCHCKPGWLGSNCTAAESSRASCGLRGGVDLIDDACLQNSADGAAVIPAGRWRVAQAAEARLWASNSTRRERDSGVPHRSGRKQRGDRAWMHVKQFGSYASLPRGSLGLVAELGAGPWTQTHFLLEARPDVTATKVTLIDPGIDGYLRSGRAIYAGGRLHGIEAELLSIPAERVPASYTERFDTLVMINVIEHTFNAFATLHTAHRLLKRGGIFIFQERCIALNARPQIYHPIRLTKSFFDAFLAGQYDEMFRFHGRTIEVRRKRRTHGIDSEVYFIGKKR